MDFKSKFYVVSLIEMAHEYVTLLAFCDTISTNAKDTLNNFEIRLKHSNSY